MKKIICYIVLFISILCLQVSYAVAGKNERVIGRAVGVLCATDHGWDSRDLDEVAGTSYVVGSSGNWNKELNTFPPTNKEYVVKMYGTET